MVPASAVGFTISNMKPHVYHIMENITMIFYTRNKHFKNTKFASVVIPKIVKIYEDYTDHQYPHNVLKYVTVPNSDTTLCEIKNGMIISRYEIKIITNF
jgi:hypothetical protein